MGDHRVGTGRDRNGRRGPGMTQLEPGIHVVSMQTGKRIKRAMPGSGR